MGNRVEKTVNNDAGAWSETEYYVRDAQGNVMAIYKKNVTSGQMNYILTEQHIYGSARLGVDRRGVDVIAASTVTDNVSRSIKRGEKHYELSNHLGNVLATVSDKKIAVMSGSNLSYYRADVASYSDYYPFGAPMTERTALVTPSDVRYGFNGKEMDSEGMGGGLSTYDYGFRIYNPHIAKFLSTDPLSKDFPWYTPYQFAGNKPIVAIDLDGLEQQIVINNVPLGPVIAVQTDVVNLSEPGPLGTGVLVVNQNQQTNSIYLVFRKSIGAAHSEAGPKNKDEASSFSFLHTLDALLTPDGGFFFTSEDGSSKSWELRSGKGETIEGIDLLLSAVTGLNKIAGNNQSLIPGNYTTFNDHTTMSNTMATIIGRLESIISSTIDISDELKSQEARDLIQSKDTVVDIHTPTEIQMLDGSRQRAFGVQENMKIKQHQIDSLESEGKIIKPASQNEKK